MAKSLMLAMALLLSAAWLHAQQYPQTSSSQTGSAGSEQASTVQGCLQGSNGNFMLTDDAGTTYQIQGDTAKLTEHVGHEVQITGTVSTSSAASTSTSPEKGTTTSASQQRAIQMQDVKHVSTTCKSPSK